LDIVCIFVATFLIFVYKFVSTVNEGAFILYTTAPYFPVGTVHIAVVDPGLGTERRGIIVQLGARY